MNASTVQYCNVLPLLPTLIICNILALGPTERNHRYAERTASRKVMAAKSLYELGKLVFPNTTTTHALQQKVSNASDDQLRKVGIPTKY